MAKTANSGDELGRAGIVMASGTILSRLLGFLGAILLARTIGTVGSGADAFALANQLPNNIYALVAGGVLTAVLVPQIVRASTADDGGAAYINKIVTVGFVIFFGLAALATLAAPLLVSLYAQEAQAGQRGFSPADIALATALAYWALPQVLFYALYSLFGEVLNAQRVFGPFTWAPVVNNVVVITGLAVFSLLFSGRDTEKATEWTPGMVALLAGGATAGIAVQALILLVFWRKAGIRYRPDFRWRGVGLSRTGRAAGWLFGMILVAQAAGVIQANVASLATGEGEAGLAILRFSWLLFMVPHSVITVSLATAYFTRMSIHARDNRLGEVTADVTTSLRRIGVMMVLASAGLFTLSVPFARLFGADTSQVTSMALVISGYALGLVPFSLVFVIQRVYYSLDDTRTPFVFQVVHAAIFIGLALFASQFPTDQIAQSLAVAASLASTLQLVVALVLLRGKLPELNLFSLSVRVLLALAAALPASLAGAGVVLLLGGASTEGFVRSSTFGAIVGIGLAGAAMAIVYIGILMVARNSDMRAVWQSATRIVQRVFTGRE